jgi:hypothetical protein
MPLADLLKDARLAPSEALLTDADRLGLSRRFVRELVGDFVRRRVRRLVALNPTNADPARRDDITPAATPVLAGIIAGEIPRAHAAAMEMWRRVSADAAHLPLDAATLRRRGTGRARDSAVQERKRLVWSITYQAAAVDITLTDTASVGGAAVGTERLHYLCDRRLRVVERMLYDVGRAGPRAWSRRQIDANPGGPWRDGYERLFEYPRLPPSLFVTACQPSSAGGRCQGPMRDWWLSPGDTHVKTLISPNPPSRSSWTRHAEYELDFQPSGGADPVAALRRLFQPSADFLGRNLLFCDHTIHALHLEALVFAMTKRGRGSAWLANEVAAHDGRWLRIHYQFNNPEQFLAGSREPQFFIHTAVREADLQVGDHLIVYSHPAYEKATVSGVWRLENALVVQTVPELKLQGHGSFLRNRNGMWEDMIGLFNAELKRRRADVAGLARVTGFGANTVTVDTTEFLSRGIDVDIVSDDPGEAVLAAGRHIVSIAGRTVRYDGPGVTASTRHRLRRARSRFFDIGLESVDGQLFRLVRRVPPSQSAYAGIHQRADWFLCWVATEAEEAIRADGPRAAFVKNQQLIDYTRESLRGTMQTIGWFPLWRPALKDKAPVRQDGRIVATDPVVVKPEQVAGWTWFLDPDPAKRDQVPVIRPKEF